MKPIKPIKSLYVLVFFYIFLFFAIFSYIFSVAHIVPFKELCKAIQGSVKSEIRQWGSQQSFVNCIELSEENSLGFWACDVVLSEENSLGFTRFLYGFTRFQQVLLGFYQVFLVFYQFLLGFTSNQSRGGGTPLSIQCPSRSYVRLSRAL